MGGPKDIVLLIGQSNMAGRAPIEESDLEPVKGAYLWHIEEKKWEPALPPYNRYSPARKELKLQRLNLGPSFAKHYLARNEGAKLGIVCAARGGTSTFQWSKETQEGHLLYQNAVESTRAALKDGGQLKAILWHQGESDRNKAKGHLDRLAKIVEDLRKDLKAPEVPFVCGQLGPWREDNADFNRDLMENVSQKIPYSACVSSADTSGIDKSHFDSKSMRIFGKRYEAALAKFSE